MKLYSVMNVRKGRFIYGISVTQAFIQINIGLLHVHICMGKNDMEDDARWCNLDMQQAAMFVWEGRRKGGVNGKEMKNREKRR